MKQLTVVLLCALSGAVWAGNGVKLSVIHTAQSFGNLESMVVSGGSWLRWRKPLMSAVLIRHPSGDILLDTGLGTRADVNFAANPWLEKQLLRFGKVSPALHQMQEAGVVPQALKGIVPTHMHWDHVDALEDFIGVPIWVPEGMLEAALEGQRAAFAREQFDDPRLVWQTLSFDDGPFESYPSSEDVFGDGALVLVELDSHTAHDVGAFVTLDSGRRFFFIGDISWTLQGVQRNQTRPWITNALVHVDRDPDRVAQVLAKIHQLSRDDPSLIIVPAHDEHVAAGMARFPRFEE